MTLPANPVTTTILVTAGYLAGHAGLLPRLLDRAHNALTWAHHRDRTGPHDLTHRLVAKPLMAFHLFVLHPIRGPRAYRNVRAERRRAEAAKTTHQPHDPTKERRT